MTNSTQVCKNCKIEKPLNEYHKDFRTANGYRVMCAVCRRHHQSITRLPKREYRLLLEKQNSCCAICGINVNELSKELSVDHNHETHKVRGLLCNSCNVGLGHFKDNTTHLAMAIEYLIASDGIA